MAARFVVEHLSHLGIVAEVSREIGIMALAFIMTLCLLVYKLAEARVRQGKAASAALAASLALSSSRALKGFRTGPTLSALSRTASSASAAEVSLRLNAAARLIADRQPGSSESELRMPN